MSDDVRNFTPSTGCTLRCTWDDRLMLSGDPENPECVYASRKGGHADWNYGAVDDRAAFVLAVTAPEPSIIRAVYEDPTKTAREYLDMLAAVEWLKVISFEEQNEKWLYIRTSGGLFKLECDPLVLTKVPTLVGRPVERVDKLDGTETPKSLTLSGNPLDMLRKDLP